MPSRSSRDAHACLITGVQCVHVARANARSGACLSRRWLHDTGDSLGYGVGGSGSGGDDVGVGVVMWRWEWEYGGEYNHKELHNVNVRETKVLN